MSESNKIKIVIFGSINQFILVKWKLIDINSFDLNTYNEVFLLQIF